MKNMFSLKKILYYLSPLLLFAILLIPYSWVNREFIVEWFGCGCPKIDELGNVITPDFNANDFTALFWGVISLGVAGISLFLSRNLSKKYTWLRILYVLAMLVVSLLISREFCQMMMWN